MGAAGLFVEAEPFGPAADNWVVLDLDGDQFRQFALAKWEIDLAARDNDDMYVACIAFHSREAAREAAELIRQALALQSVPAPDPEACTHEGRAVRHYAGTRGLQDVCQDCGTVFGKVD